MEVDLYFVYGILPNGDTTEKRVNVYDEDDVK